MKRILFVKEWLKKKRFEEMAQRLRNGETLTPEEDALRKEQMQKHKKKHNLF